MSNTNEFSTKLVIFDNDNPDEVVGFVHLKTGIFITPEEKLHLHFKEGVIDHLTFEQINSKPKEDENRYLPANLIRQAHSFFKKKIDKLYKTK